MINDEYLQVLEENLQVEEEVPESKPSILNKEELGWSIIIEKDLNDSLSRQYRDSTSEQYRDIPTLHSDKTPIFPLQLANYKNGNKIEMMKKDRATMDGMETGNIVRGMDRLGKSLLQLERNKKIMNESTEECSLCKERRGFENKCNTCSWFEFYQKFRTEEPTRISQPCVHQTENHRDSLIGETSFTQADDKTTSPNRMRQGTIMSASLLCTYLTELGRELECQMDEALRYADDVFLSHEGKK